VRIEEQNPEEPQQEAQEIGGQQNHQQNYYFTPQTPQPHNMVNGYVTTNENRGQDGCKQSDSCDIPCIDRS
jgi:hypothetical protein